MIRPHPGSSDDAAPVQPFGEVGGEVVRHGWVMTDQKNPRNLPVCLVFIGLAGRVLRPRSSSEAEAGVCCRLFVKVAAVGEVLMCRVRRVVG